MTIMLCFGQNIELLPFSSSHKINSLLWRLQANLLWIDQDIDDNVQFW